MLEQTDAEQKEKNRRRDAFITQNLGLVHSCARRFAGRGLEYDDIYAAGCMGLVKAADAFDERRGVKFSTYAVPVILGEMRQLFRSAGTVKVSRSLKERAMQAMRVRQALMHASGREPTAGEIAKQMGLSPEEVAQAMFAAMAPVSLTERDDGSQIEIPTESPFEALTQTLVLKENLLRLPPQDRRLILMRYFGGATQSKVAAALGMTQVQVSRREKKILKELKSRMT